MNRGKLVILTILGLALSLAGFSVWYLHQQSRRAAEFWGSDFFQQICHAPRVDLLRLGPSQEVLMGRSATAQVEVIDGRFYAVQGSRDISEVHGRLLLRESLAKDDSFVWDEPRPPIGKWQYLLRFRNEGHEPVDIAISVERELVGDPARGTAISIAPIAEGMKKFIDEQFRSGTSDQATRAKP